jgi:hypothetical protein
MDNVDILMCLKKELDLLTEQNDFLIREKDSLLLEVLNYEKRIDKLSKKYKELEKENYPIKLAILEEEHKKLQKRCEQKQLIIDKNIAFEILDYLSEFKSLTKTAEEFRCSPEELYYCIPDWDKCNDRLYGLIDYDIYKNKLEGRWGELDNLEEINNYKKRTPEDDELKLILADYSSGNFGLYQLADKYNLIIINLFRLLKEQKLINKESDANGYNDFYKEYIGEYSYNKYNINTNLKLIDMFYNNIKS